jgi:hypothetical protein
MADVDFCVAHGHCLLTVLWREVHTNLSMCNFASETALLVEELFGCM